MDTKDKRHLAVQWGSLAFLIGMGLFGDSRLTAKAPVLRNAFHDSAVLWAAFAYAMVCYLWLEGLISRRTPKPSRSRRAKVEFCLQAGLILATARLLTEGAAWSDPPRVLIILVSVTFGKAALNWFNWASQKRKSSMVILTFLDIYLVILTMVFILFRYGAQGFYYRGAARWDGLWDNPNIYGLVMGTGLVLAIGRALLWHNWWHSDLRLTIPLGKCMNHKGLAGNVLSVFSAVLMGCGVLKSYSRGAWAAAAIAALGLIWHIRGTSGRQRQAESSSPSGRHHTARMNFAPVCVVFISIAVLCFWQFRHTDLNLLRRLFSVANVNDFSWRNRVAAWEGALQMMADHPLFGLGWNGVPSIYQHYYADFTLSATAAILMNDYCFMGGAVGLPALLCFGAYFWHVLVSPTFFGATLRDNGYGNGPALRSTPSPDEPDATLNLAYLNRCQIICRAAAVVMLVGFGFDGGMFSLPTAALFWMLLELGRQTDP